MSQKFRRKAGSGRQAAAAKARKKQRDDAHNREYRRKSREGEK